MRHHHHHHHCQQHQHHRHHHQQQQQCIISSQMIKRIIIIIIIIINSRCHLDLVHMRGSLKPRTCPALPPKSHTCPALPCPLPLASTPLQPLRTCTMPGSKTARAPPVSWGPSPVAQSTSAPSSSSAHPCSCRRPRAPVKCTCGPNTSLRQRKARGAQAGVGGAVSLYSLPSWGTPCPCHPGHPLPLPPWGTPSPPLNYIQLTYHMELITHAHNSHTVWN